MIPWTPDAADPKVGSFMPYLRRVCEASDGPILELGTGYFSSPYLQTWYAAGRDVWGYEHDKEWADAVRASGVAYPILPVFTALPARIWDVVLIDCEGWNRAPFFDTLREATRTFVIHDAQDPWIPDDALDGFTYRTDFDTDPRTTVVSDVMLL